MARPLDTLLANTLVFLEGQGLVPGSIGIADGRIAVIGSHGQDMPAARMRPSIARACGPCRASSTARALRLRLARNRFRNRVAQRGPGRHDQRHFVPSLGRYPRSFDAVRARRKPELHRFRLSLRHHQPPARGHARRDLAPLRRQLVQAVHDVQRRRGCPRALPISTTACCGAR